MLGSASEPIIRVTIQLPRPAAAALTVLVMASGCGVNNSSSGQPAGSPRVISHSPAKTPTPGPGKVWVISPIGLNVRSGPDVQSTRVATLAQGADLTVLEQRQTGGQTWLHIRTQSGLTDGWVLDAPELVIHRAVSQHLDNGWSILFPDKWEFKEGNPATFTSPPTDPDGGLLLVQTADDASKLLTTPLTAGKELREEAPVEIYGKTTFITIYQLTAGGYEFASTVKSDSKKTFLFDYKQSARPEADTALFHQLLASVILT